MDTAACCIGVSPTELPAQYYQLEVVSKSFTLAANWHVETAALARNVAAIRGVANTLRTLGENDGRIASLGARIHKLDQYRE
jgi:hypothetical protein